MGIEKMKLHHLFLFEFCNLLHRTMGERAEGREGVSKQGPYLKTSQYAPSTTTRGL